MPLKHPTRGDDLTDLEKFLWRFRMVAHEAQVMWRGFNGYPDVAKVINEDLLFGLSNQALVVVCKFLEIWDQFGTLVSSEPRVASARRAVQPLIDRMRVWKGLDRFRNTTLAHPYTTKSGDLLPPWELLGSGQAPSFHAEQILLLQLVAFGSTAVLAVFEREFDLIQPLTQPPTRALSPNPGIARGSEILGAIRPILADVDARLLNECGVTVSKELREMFRGAIGA